jgi:predicted GNAT family N-acyltransferase
MAYRYEIVQDPSGLEAARRIRVAVFVDEQGIPKELELDEIDSEAVHVLALDDDVPVATGRLSVSGETGIIARIAVLPEYRGSGIGRRVVSILEEKARKQNLPAVELSPHYYLESFYSRLGYHRMPGEEHVAGHRLIRMRKELE